MVPIKNKITKKPQSLDSHSHDITIDRPNELRNSSKRIKYIGGLKV